MKTSGMFHMVWYGYGFINRVIKCGHKWLKIVLNGVEPVGNMLNTSNVTGRQVLPAPLPEHSKKKTWNPMTCNIIYVPENTLRQWIMVYWKKTNFKIFPSEQNLRLVRRSDHKSDGYLMVVVFPLVDLYIHTIPYHTITLHYIKAYNPKQMDELAGMLNQKKPFWMTIF